MEFQSVINGVSAIINALLVKESILFLSSIVGMGAITYSVLHFFTLKKIKVDYGETTPSYVERSTLVQSMVLIAIPVISIVLIYAQPVTPGLLAILCLNVIAAFFISKSLKRRINVPDLPENATSAQKRAHIDRYGAEMRALNQHFLFEHAITAILRIIGKYLIAWIGTIIVTIIGAGHSIVNKAFMSQYLAIAVVLNISCTLFIAQISGASAGASSANLVGGAIAGLVHWKMNYKKISMIGKEDSNGTSS